MNNIQEQLWEYLDGTLDTERRREVQQLIETDAAWKNAWQNELVFYQSLQNLDLEEPSMGFNYGVMEAIRQETALAPLKTRINPVIIWGIGIFFFLSLVMVLSVAFRQLNLADLPGETMYTLPVSKVKTAIAGKNVLQIGMFAAVILLLFLGDKLLNRQLHQKISAT